MRPKKAKRERQGEQLGRGTGIIGRPHVSEHEEWIGRLEDRIEAAQKFAWQLFKVRPNAKPAWQTTEKFPFWVTCPPKCILGVKQHDCDGRNDNEILKRR